MKNECEAESYRAVEKNRRWRHGDELSNRLKGLVRAIGNRVLFSAFLARLTLRLGVSVFSILLLTGCNMYDQIIKEMDSAYAINEKNEDVSRVVQKYFPPGMKVEEAFKLLHLLYEQGFEVRENRLDGARKWPDGELKPYRDEATKKNRLQMDPKGVMVNYTITKKYDSKYFVVTKEAFIYLRTDGEKLVESKGAIFVRGI